MSFLPSFVSHWRNALSFSSTTVEEKDIVFYSEGKPSAPHLGPLIRELISRGRTVQLLISDKDDPLANSGDLKIISHWIGSGAARVWVHSSLAAKVYITTTPDLETMQLKRSKNDVFYVYAHHSMISHHMGYRPGAFDHFDAVLCTGAHQIEETRSTEELMKLEAKVLVEQGYCRLDELRAANSEGDEVANGDKTTILLAPTWGENSILPICGEELIQLLLESDYNVILRPHPESVRKNPELIRSLLAKFSAHEGFEYDPDSTGDIWMQRSDLMISDWSGVAMEYAYGFEKPVLFIDLPKKVNNPDYEQLGIPPMEISIREEIGSILGVGEISKISDVVQGLISPEANNVESIRTSRERRVFNEGRSASVGADFIEQMVDSH